MSGESYSGCLSTSGDRCTSEHLRIFSAFGSPLTPESRNKLGSLWGTFCCLNLSLASAGWLYNCVYGGKWLFLSYICSWFKTDESFHFLFPNSVERNSIWSAWVKWLLLFWLVRLKRRGNADCALSRDSGDSICTTLLKRGCDGGEKTFHVLWYSSNYNPRIKTSK